MQITLRKRWIIFGNFQKFSILNFFKYCRTFLLTIGTICWENCEWYVPSSFEKFWHENYYQKMKNNHWKKVYRYICIWRVTRKGGKHANIFFLLPIFIVPIFPKNTVKIFFARFPPFLVARHIYSFTAFCYTYIDWNLNLRNSQFTPLSHFS